MFNDPAPPEPRSGIRIYLLVSTVVFVIAAGYVGWVFYARWQQNEAINAKAAAAAAAKEKSDAERVYQEMGGNRFDILKFYADPNRIESGQTADLCYSVSNAQSVKLEPQSQPVWPAFIHCVQVSPTKTTEYTLTAEDAAGHIKSAQVTVRVQ
ncbi:MAG TPA: hypothetical protein VFB23_13060 [Candidatus Acidoferrales bacterium]|jgi:hypothetical protein|nr:hypothetical protein [Candidatus Acidoferrales bacterium]